MVHPIDAAKAFLGFGNKATPAPTIDIPAPPGLTPAQQPSSKPARKSQQSSFLSGAAMAQQAGAAGGGGGTTGKTLIGS